MSDASTSSIVKTSDVCFGRARIHNTRIPVWLLVAYRKSGTTDERLIEFYPHLTAADLQAALGTTASTAPARLSSDLVLKTRLPSVTRGDAAVCLDHCVQFAVGHSRG